MGETLILLLILGASSGFVAGPFRRRWWVNNCPNIDVSFSANC